LERLADLADGQVSQLPGKEGDVKVLMQFMQEVENLEPALFFVLNGDKARGELEQLIGDTALEIGVTLVRVNGKPQEIVSTRKIGAQYSRGKWMAEVPVVVVRERK
jgi:hypothetical protein